VPLSLTDRFQQLALSLGDGRATPYDQAVAVTSWLRDNMQYSRVTDAPPAEQDPLDWFVFDYKVGFCNYYASSEVMMLRVLGVPARLAVGYASGTEDSSTGVYEVSSLDSHAWPEVFFPGYGWVPFEPTASQPDIRRSETSASQSAQLDQANNGASANNPSDPLARFNRFEEGQSIGAGPTGQAEGSGLSRLVAPVTASVLIILIGALFINLDPAWKQSTRVLGRRTLGWLGLRDSQAGRAAGTDPAEATSGIYMAWASWLPRLGIDVEPNETPFERLSHLVSDLPVAEAGSRQIVEAYVAERFGGRPPQENSVHAAWSQLHRLFWATYLARITGRLLALVQDPQRRDGARRGQAPSALN
jgi:hypothetical protein